jgi:glycosyltransferase involved in cell wall biosynthesis
MITRNLSRVVVLIPCYNEEVAIGQVVRDFRAAIPDAVVMVFDNNSKDRTIEVALEAGAIVRRVPLQGKGNVVRRMFADVEADIYVLVDGDDTYDAASVNALIERVRNGGCDMVVGKRLSDEQAAYRQGHRWGNRMLTACVSMLFGRTFTDILSGYRAFSRRFVKSFPALASGFEIETELTVHALELRMPTDEVDTPYKARPEGSFSKLNTYRDGFRILRTIATLFRQERPLLFFGIIAAVFALMAFGLSMPLLTTYFETGMVPRFPTAILVTGLGLTAIVSMGCGLILDTVTKGRHEVKRLFYLQTNSPSQPS